MLEKFEKYEIIRTCWAVTFPCTCDRRELGVQITGIPSLVEVTRVHYLSVKREVQNSETHENEQREVRL